jgi:hypothetical protein
VLTKGLRTEQQGLQTMPFWTILMSAAVIAVTTAERPAQLPECGMGTRDWCPAQPGDACGRHRDVASCKADPACFGMPYLGESYVPCILDSRGFASNCPTVGCTSVPPQRRRSR